MKTCAVLMLLIFGCAAAAVAHPPRWYVGGSVQGNAVLEQLRFLPTTDVRRSGNGYLGIGMQIEGGIAANIGNVYMGFRQDISGFQANGRGSGNHENNRWLGERFLLGVRLHVSDEYANPVKPLLGAGISYGWGQRRLESQRGNWGGELTEERSKGALGWMAETGFLVKVRPRVLLSFLLHYDMLNTQFGDPSLDGTVENVHQGSLQLGVQYQLPGRL